MGMTIDDHIEALKSYNHGFTGYAGNLQDSIDIAIDIMRKYQKIEQILKEPCIIPDGCYPMLNKIKRVIKDEDVD